MKIEYKDLGLYAYTNEKMLAGKIRGIVICFRGLNANSMMNDEDEGMEYARSFAEKGILTMTPYINPWGWMNAQSVLLTNAVVESLFEHYGFPDDFPIVSTGGSMGGLCAITYCRYANRTPKGCVANCPVCDLPYHYTERPDLPRTLWSAFGDYPMTLNEAMETASPLHLAELLPDIEYTIFHCEADQAVNKQKHSDRFVEALKKNHRVTYIAVPDRGHCDLTPEARERYYAAAAELCNA